MRHGIFIIFFLFLMASICFIFFIPGICCADNIEDTKGEQEQQQLFTGYLYFIDKDGRYLKSVEQKFAAGLDPHNFGLAIIQALIEGPSLKDLEQTVPKGTKVNALFI